MKTTALHHPLSLVELRAIRAEHGPLAYAEAFDATRAAIRDQVRRERDAMAARALGLTA